MNESGNESVRTPFPCAFPLEKHGSRLIWSNIDIAAVRLVGTRVQATQLAIAKFKKKFVKHFPLSVKRCVPIPIENSSVVYRIASKFQLYFYGILSRLKWNLKRQQTESPEVNFPRLNLSFMQRKIDSSSSRKRLIHAANGKMVAVSRHHKKPVRHFGNCTLKSENARLDLISATDPPVQNSITLVRWMSPNDKTGDKTRLLLLRSNVFEPFYRFVRTRQISRVAYTTSAILRFIKTTRHHFTVYIFCRSSAWLCEVCERWGRGALGQGLQFYLRRASKIFCGPL